MTPKQAKRGRGKKDDRPGCLGRLLTALGLGPGPTREIELPYRLHSEFLSPAEYSLYRALGSAVQEWAIICPKAGLETHFDPSCCRTINHSDGVDRNAVRLDPSSVHVMVAVPIAERNRRSGRSIHT